FAHDTPCELNILRHNGYSLCVNGVSSKSPTNPTSANLHRKKKKKRLPLSQLSDKLDVKGSSSIISSGLQYVNFLQLWKHIADLKFWPSNGILPPPQPIFPPGRFSSLMPLLFSILAIDYTIPAYSGRRSST
ncbi:hypothetical protein PanWU01x14_022980, partial [Parasponia andersonii]